MADASPEPVVDADVGPAITSLGLPVANDALGAEHRFLAATWGVGNGLVLSIGRKEEEEEEEGETTAASTTTTVSQWDRQLNVFRWNQIPESRLRFASSTHTIFCVLQQLVRSSKRETGIDMDVEADSSSSSSANAATLPVEYRLAQSRAYRKEMEIQLEYLLSDECDMPKVERDFNMDLFRDMHSIWHLAEMLLITATPGNFVTDDILSWLDYNYPIAQDSLIDVTEKLDPSVHADFWPVLFNYALRGDVANCCRVLEGSVFADRFDSVVPVIRSLFQKMPRQSQFASSGEFLSRWMKWQQEVKSVRSNELPKRVTEDLERKGLEDLLDLLQGDESLIEAKTNTWFEALAAKLLYKYPTSQLYDLPSYVENVYQDSELETVDRALLAILELDVTQLIRLCSEKDLWLVSHLSDFLQHCDQMETQETDDKFQCQMREYFLLDYAVMLLEHPMLWRIAVDYLSACPVFGAEYMEQYIVRIPLDSERKLRKVLEACRENGLFGSRTIHRILGRRGLERKMYADAIYHYIQAGDAVRVSAIANLLLDAYLRQGKLTYLNIIESLGPHVEQVESLSFLSLYSDFHISYKAGQYRNAAKLLIQILTSSAAPKFFWPVLLVDALPLLEGSKVLFGVDDTYELMRCLEELLSSHRKQEYLESITESELEVVRLALVRNLARAMVQVSSAAASASVSS